MTILTSLHGRQIGLDRFGNLESPKGFRTNNVTAASTAATIGNNGITTLGSTAGNNLTFHLDAPVVGVNKTLIATGASTGQVVSSTGSGASFGSTTGAAKLATFTGMGQSLSLVGLSTALWGILGGRGTVALSS